VSLLCVSGDHVWDRIPPWSRIDNPEMFEQAGSRPVRP
jgi:hypothetical protein